MNKGTMNAIIKRIRNGETRFFIGSYYYDCSISGIIRRREQEAGRTPTTNWECIANWDPMTLEITEVQ